MSGFEVEGYILSGTLVLTFLVKAAKWLLEELIAVVPIYKKLKATLSDELPIQPPLALIDTRSKSVSVLVSAIARMKSKSLGKWR